MPSKHTTTVAFFIACLGPLLFFSQVLVVATDSTPSSSSYSNGKEEEGKEAGTGICSDFFPSSSCFFTFAYCSFNSAPSPQLLIETTVLPPPPPPTPPTCDVTRQKTTVPFVTVKTMKNWISPYYDISTGLPVVSGDSSRPKMTLCQVIIMERILASTPDAVQVPKDKYGYHTMSKQSVAHYTLEKYHLSSVEYYLAQESNFFRLRLTPSDWNDLVTTTTTTTIVPTKESGIFTIE